ncbi:MAG: hypothetical protein E7575_02770 [Ruminococcaceae bacterium]|nr:hypothetical protein [Oscillospiraceae bacterium]
MEVIRIKSNKLILSLTKDDVAKYSVNKASGAEKLKESYSRIITDAKIDTSFLSGAFVQIFDFQDGGCEMFVTKISEDNDPDLYEKSGSYIYKFSNINSFIAACHAYEQRKGTDAKIYIQREKRNFYILMEQDLPYLKEFGGQKCDCFPIEYLIEHCKSLNTDAIKRIAALA